MSINYSNYVQHAMRTNSDTVGTYNVPQDLIHSALGLSDELVELDQAFDKADKVNIIEEISDIMWFTALACNEVGVSLRTPLTLPDNNIQQARLDLRDDINSFVSIIKRWYAYGKEPNMQDLAFSISQIVSSFTWLSLSLDEDPCEIMQKNIDKLAVRFPDKFTPEAANNRDTDKERKVLESQSLNATQQKQPA